MRRRFEEEQLVSVLKDHEAGTPTAELCQREGVSEQTLYH